MKLAYDSSGSGPTVVLLHGYLSSRKYWKSVVRLLRDDYRVITIDLLGFGRSPKPHGAHYHIDNHAALVAHTVQQLTNGKPVIMVGHSMGAQVAARVAGAYPALVSKLVLANMPVFLDTQAAHNSYYATGWFHRVSLYSKKAKYVWPLIQLIRPALQFVLRGGRVAYSPRHTNASRYFSLVDTVEQGTAPELLHKLACPTFLIMARRDRKAYGENLARMTLPPNLHVEWVTTSHHTPQENPEYIVRVIRSL